MLLHMWEGFVGQSYLYFLPRWGEPHLESGGASNQDIKYICPLNVLTVGQQYFLHSAALKAEVAH